MSSENLSSEQEAEQQANCLLNELANQQKGRAIILRRNTEGRLIAFDLVPAQELQALREIVKLQLATLEKLKDLKFKAEGG